MTKIQKTEKYRRAYVSYPRMRLDFPLPSLAKQSFKDECDINRIMFKFEKTGMVAHLNTYQGNYGSALGSQDYHSSLNQVLAAKAAFLSLPSKIRGRFANNPGDFLAFIDNPDNKTEAIKLGILPDPDQTMVETQPILPTPPTEATPEPPSTT